MKKHRTIHTETGGIYRDRGSKFIAYAIPVNSVDDCNYHIGRIKSEHPKARHWCFAYRIGPGGEQHRSSDDGEPSGTAGKPISQQIESFGLTDILVVVVRYFGGKLLGTSGLIAAYKKSAQDALARARILEKEEVIFCKFRFRYAIMGQLLSSVKNKSDVKVLEKDFSDQPSITVSIPSRSFVLIISSILKEVLGIHRVEISAPIIFPDLEVEIIQD